MRTWGQTEGPNTEQFAIVKEKFAIHFFQFWMTANGFFWHGGLGDISMFTVDAKNTHPFTFLYRPGKSPESKNHQSWKFTRKCNRQNWKIAKVMKFIKKCNRHSQTHWGLLLPFGPSPAHIALPPAGLRVVPQLGEEKVRLFRSIVPISTSERFENLGAQAL